MKKTLWQTRGTLISIFLLSVTMCNADTITIDLVPPLLSGPPGSVTTFSGALSNTTASPVFLNSAGINLSGGFTSADEDTGLFFINAPLFLGTGDVTPTIDLFTVSIPNPFAQGPYQGTFTVLGGVDGNAQGIVGSANFTIQVSNVSEPSSTVLLGIAIFALVLYRTLLRCGSSVKTEL